jgi:hypothetical protein
MVENEAIGLKRECERKGETKTVMRAYLTRVMER